MKAILLSSIFFLPISAFAADLAMEPVEMVVPAPETMWYIGGNANISADGDVSLGASVGYDVTPNITLEGRYERIIDEKQSDRVLGSVLVGNELGVFKPYVHAGVGYEWGDVDRSIYAIGVGTKIHYTPTVDFDIRYRYQDGISKGGDDHIFTTGVEFRF